MNTLCIAIFACVVVAAHAGVWGGYGYGHLPVVGASGVVSSGGAAGPAGVVTGNGAIGPNGEHNSLYDGWVDGHGAWGHDWVGAHGVGVVGPAAIVGHGLGLGRWGNWGNWGNWGQGHW